MSSELEVVTADGVRQVVVVARDAHALQQLGVYVMHVAGGVRIEPIRMGALLHIDGEEVLAKQLCVGEFVVIEGVRLRCLSAAADLTRSAAVAAEPLARAIAPALESPARRSARARRPAPRRTNWLPASALTAALLVVAIFVKQQLSNSTWPHSPKHFLELAQAQYDNNKPERALETLAFAMRDATGSDHEQAVLLDAKIRRMLLGNASALQVSDARYEHDLLNSFVATYLQSPERPAARECVRLCDVWLEAHREACAAHSQGQQLLAAVVAMRERYQKPAEWDAPESAADVVFAAECLMRFQWRDYIGAVARLDAFLSRDASNEVVLAARKLLIEEGEPWLQKRLRRLDGTIARGDISNAEKDLAQLDRWVAIPEWQAAIAERRALLTSKR